MTRRNRSSSCCIDLLRASTSPASLLDAHQSIAQLGQRRPLVAASCRSPGRSNVPGMATSMARPAARVQNQQEVIIRLLMAAETNPLMFHDLRHEAGSRCLTQCHREGYRGLDEKTGRATRDLTIRCKRA